MHTCSKVIIQGMRGEKVRIGLHVFPTQNFGTRIIQCTRHFLIYFLWSEINPGMRRYTSLHFLDSKFLEMHHHYWPRMILGSGWQLDVSVLARTCVHVLCAETPPLMVYTWPDTPRLDMSISKAHTLLSKNNNNALKKHTRLTHTHMIRKHRLIDNAFIQRPYRMHYKSSNSSQNMEPMTAVRVYFSKLRLSTFQLLRIRKCSDTLVQCKQAYTYKNITTQSHLYA